MTLEELRRKVKDMPSYKRTLAALDNFFVYDVEGYTHEIHEIQRQRSERPIHGLQKQPKRSIMRYSSEDNAYRSRAIYIQMLTRRVRSNVDPVKESITSWCLMELKPYLAGTVAEKRAIVYELTPRLNSFIAALYQLDVACDLLVSDIDQSMWIRKNVVALLDISTRPESKV